MPPPPPPPPPSGGAPGPYPAGWGDAAAPLDPPQHAPERRIRWGIGDVIISFVVMFVVSGVVLAIGAVALGFDADELEDPQGEVFLLMMLATWIGELTWPTIVMFWKGTGRPWRDFGLSFQWLDLAWGVGGFVVLNALSIWAGLVYLLLSSDDEVPSNTDMVDTETASGLLLVALFIGIAVITPIIEELVFRGFFLRAVDRRFGLAPAMVSSSLVFGLLHLSGLALQDVWVVLLLTCYGVVFATLTVVNKGRIGASIVAHMLNNAMVFLVVLA